MKPKGLCCGLMLLALLLDARAEAPAAKPVRIWMSYHAMGMVYNWFNERDPFFHHFYYGRQGEKAGSLDSNTLSDYSTIILCEVWDRDFKVTAETVGRFHEFVANGGNLVVVGKAANYFSSPGVADQLLGVAEIKTAYPVPCEIVAPAHPLLAALLGGAPPTGGGNDAAGRTLKVSPLAQGVVSGKPLLMYKGKYVAALERELGKGKILLLPDELFPPFGPPQSAGAIDEKMLLPNIHSFLEQLFVYLKAPLLTDAIRQNLKVTPFTAARLLVWHRDPDHDRFQGAHMLHLPGPVDQKEIVNKIERMAGINEHERFPLYVTTQGDREGAVSVRAVRTSGTEPDVFKDVDIRSQGKPAAGVAGPTVYLSDLEQKGDARIIPVAPCDTKTLWVCFDTKGAAPGVQKGDLVFLYDGVEQKVEVQLNIRDVALPDYHLLHFEAETNELTVQVGGNKENKEAAAKNMEAAARDLASAHVNHLMSSPCAYDSPKVKGTNQVLNDYLTPENAAAFGSKTLPGLDFSSADWFFEEAIRHGLVIHRFYYNYNAERFLPQVAKMLGKEKVTVESKEGRVFMDWYMAEALKYIQEKGYRFIYLKHGDEWMPSSMDDILKNTRPLRKLGWKIVLNPQGKEVLGVPEFRKQIKAEVDILQAMSGMKDYVETWNEMRKERPLAGPDGLMLMTTSSWWWNKPLNCGYAFGYTLAYNDVPGFHFHGWTRGAFRGGVYLEKNEGRIVVHPSIGYLFLGEGIEEAEYLVMAKRLIRHAEKQGVNVEIHRNKLDQIIGKGEALLKMHFHDELAMDVPEPPEKPTLPLATYRQAKEKLLDLVLELRGKVGKVKRNLRWGDHSLNPPGNAALSIQHPPELQECARKLQGLLAKKSEDTLPVQTQAVSGNWGNVPKGTTVWLTDVADEKDRQRLLGLFPKVGVTDSYPAPGHYALIGPLAHGQGHVVIIAGRGKDGVDLGCESWPRFIEDAY